MQYAKSVIYSRRKSILIALLACLSINSLLFAVFCFMPQFHTENATRLDSWWTWGYVLLQVFRLGFAFAVGYFLRRWVKRVDVVTSQKKMHRNNHIAGGLIVLWCLYKLDFGDLDVQYRLMTLFHGISTMGQVWSGTYREMPLFGRYLWETVGSPDALLAYVLCLGCLLVLPKEKEATV